MYELGGVDSSLGVCDLSSLDVCDLVQLVREYGFEASLEFRHWLFYAICTVSL